MKLNLDLTQSGLLMAFIEREVLMLHHLWKDENLPPDEVPTFRPKTYGANSSTLTTMVNRVLTERHGERTSGRPYASRSSVINSSNMLVGNGIWDYYEKTGKGGYQKVYYAKMTKLELLNTIKNIVLDKIYRT